MVYGPKAAFNIGAPEGWVLDNQAGKEQGLPCVLYRKGDSWSDARTVMYVKIASTQFEDVNDSWQRRSKTWKNARKTEREHCFRQNQGRPWLLHQRVSGDENLLAMGTRGLRPTSARGRLHRAFIARPGELPKRFWRTGRRAEKYFCLFGTEERLRQSLTIRQQLAVTLTLSTVFPLRNSSIICT